MILPPDQALDIGLFEQNGPMPVARLAMAKGVGQLEWSAAISERHWFVDPLQAPEPGLIAAPGPGFYGLHPFLADSLPDGWGMRLMKRKLARRDIRIDDLNGIERLALIGNRGRGALVYAPAVFEGSEPSPIDLDLLALEAASILRYEEGALAEMLEQLGGGSGGARPKLHIGYLPDGSMCAGDNLDGEHAMAEQWIVKFAGPADAQDIGPVEQAYATLARNAGIDMAPSQLIASAKGPPYFATRRFDRPAPLKRTHMVSLAGALRVNWSEPAIGYHQFMQATRYITRNQRDVEEVFRRMVFNILASNRDDHAGQHSFLMDENGEWRLSPAYDLTFSNGPGGEHYLDVAGEGRMPTREHVMQLADQHSIPRPRAEQVIDDVSSSLSNWSEVAQGSGVTHSLLEIATRMKEIAAIFVRA